MSDTNDQYDLRSFACMISCEQATRSGQCERGERSTSNCERATWTTRSVRKTNLDLVHSRSDHKTCISKHRDRINSIRSSYSMTDLAGVRVSLAVIRETLTSISEKDRLIEDVVPDERLQAELETACDFRAEVRKFIQHTNDFL